MVRASLDLGGNGLRELAGVHLDEDPPVLAVVVDQRARGVGEHLEPVPDHLRGVIRADPGEQPLDQYRLRHMQIHGGIEGQVQLHAEFGGRDGLRQGRGKSVQYVSARGRDWDE